MAFVKMLWAEKLYDFSIKVKPSIRNSGGGTSTFNIQVKPTIRNANNSNALFSTQANPDSES